jgi:tRNA (Thr-GGU) A37 N-methylase
MLSMEPIGYVRSPYRDTGEIPKGLGAKHDAEGVLEIRAEFEPGLTDIEGFSHLFVIWAFDRSEGFNLVGTPERRRVTISRTACSRPARRGVRPRLG